MRLLLTMYGSRGDVEPMMGLAVRVRTLGAALEHRDAPLATGGWR
jgi:hypothetical protein